MTKAKYKGVGNGVKEVLWMQKFLCEVVGCKLSSPTRIQEDKKGCIKLAMQQDNQSSFQSKHLDLRHHFICEEIEKGTIQLTKTFSKENCADFLTKALLRQLLMKCLTFLHVQ